MTLVLSPHLDDAAFSCGGLLAGLKDAVVVTCFTSSVLNPVGFALACQRDKHLPDDVDYMALRRAEDERAMRSLGVAHKWWAFREAPHRGYDSAADLFAGIHDDDQSIADDLRKAIVVVMENHKIETILYPYGAGRHVDHLQVISAVEGLRDTGGVKLIQYFDQPYTNKHRGMYGELGNARSVTPEQLLSSGSGCLRLTPAVSDLKRKYAACAAYTTQVPFQFGDDGAMRALLGGDEYYFVS